MVDEDVGTHMPGKHLAVRLFVGVHHSLCIADGGGTKARALRRRGQPPYGFVHRRDVYRGLRDCPLPSAYAERVDVPSAIAGGRSLQCAIFKKQKVFSHYASS